MCAPVAGLTAFQVLSLGVSAASAGVGFLQQRQQANRAEAAYRQNEANALAALRERQEENRQQAMSKVVDIQRESLKRVGTMRVAAGEAGLSGLVLDSLLQGEAVETGIAVGRNSLNYRNATRQNSRDKQGVRARTDSKVNSLDRGSFLKTGLQIAGAAAGEFAKVPDPVEPPKEK